jgi:hypothetical protein
MKIEIVPVNIEMETNVSSRPELRHSYLNVSFKVAGEVPGQGGTLKVNYDLEFAARVEEAIKKRESLTLTIE